MGCSTLFLTSYLAYMYLLVRKRRFENMKKQKYIFNHIANHVANHIDVVWEIVPNT